MRSPFLFIFQFTIVVFLCTIVKAIKTNYTVKFYYGNESDSMRYDVAPIGFTEPELYQFEVKPGDTAVVYIDPREIKPDTVDNYVFCFTPYHAHSPEGYKKGSFKSCETVLN